MTRRGMLAASGGLAAITLLPAQSRAQATPDASPVSITTSWLTPLGSRSRSRPLVTDTAIVAGLSDKSAVLLDRLNGDIRWRTPLSEAAMDQPVALGDSVVFGGEFGTLFVLDLESGEITNQMVVSSLGLLSPLVRGDMLVIPDTGGLIQAVSQDQLRAEWNVQIVSSLRFTGILAGEQAVFITDGGNVVAIEAETGKIIDQNVLTGSPRVPLLSNGQTIVACMDSREVHVIDGSTLGVRWTAASPGRVSAVPDIIGTRILTGEDPGMVTAMDALTGDTIWQQAMTGSVRCVANSGDFLYAVTEDGVVSSFEQDGGRVVDAITVVADATIVERHPSGLAIMTGAGDVVWFPF